mgnify:CR=1 FL=1
MSTSSLSNTNTVKLLLIIIAAGLYGCKSDSEKQQELGQQVVKDNCKICHAQGINGAPIIGNKKMWSGRIEQDEEVLVQHATEGFGLMPAKGGKEHLTETEIRAAVAYLKSRVNP